MLRTLVELVLQKLSHQKERALSGNEWVVQQEEREELPPGTVERTEDQLLYL
jgi:hypothetical protein